MAHQQKIQIMSFARLKFNRAEKAFNDMFKATGPAAAAINKLAEEIDQVSDQIKIAESKSKLRKTKSKPNREEKKNASMLAKQNERSRIKQIADARRKAEQNQFVNSDLLGPREVKRKETVFATRVIDTSQLVPLRLDKNTVVFIKPDADPEEVKRKFRERKNDF